MVELPVLERPNGVGEDGVVLRPSAQPFGMDHPKNIERTVPLPPNDRFCARFVMVPPNWTITCSTLTFLSDGHRVAVFNS